MRFVAGRGAVAELLLAGEPVGRPIGKLLAEAQAAGAGAKAQNTVADAS